jgi:hypothetical protein
MREIDFSNVQDQSVTLPEGVYSVVIENIEFNTEKQYYNWQFGIIECEEEEHKGAFNGRKLWAITSLKENALWKLQQFLKGLGEDDEALASSFTFDEERYLQQECKVLVKHREYNGKIMSDVDSILDEDATEAVALFK